MEGQAQNANLWMFDKLTVDMWETQQEYNVRRVGESQEKLRYASLFFFGGGTIIVEGRLNAGCPESPKKLAKVFAGLIPDELQLNE